MGDNVLINLAVLQMDEWPIFNDDDFTTSPKHLYSMDQGVLSETELPPASEPILHILPLALVACATASILVFLFSVVSGLRLAGLTSKVNGPPPDENARATEPSVPRQFPQQRRSRNIIVIWRLFRLLACIGLTLITVLPMVLAKEHGADGSRPLGWNTREVGAWIEYFNHPSLSIPDLMSAAKRDEFLLCVFYIYTTLLAISTLILGPRYRAITNSHLTIILLLAFGGYTYLDLKPLALSATPVDQLTHTSLTWVHLATLGFAAAVVPLCVPRLYAPLDPNSPINPEQTAPLISLVSYQFLDSLIWTAYRARKLQFDQLPPLADYDRAAYLKQKSFDQLDPFRSTKQQHLFWGLVHVFRKEYYIMATMTTIKSLMDFTGPIGIRFLLKYLEDPLNPGPIRPWVWVFWLFAGPVLGSIVIEWYKFFSTRTMIYAEGVLTQLVFEHTLRVRMVAEPSDGNTDNQGGPENSRKPNNASGSNLVGKITNLMSTDLKNISEGVDFPHVVLNAPIQIIVSIVFLYNILGWSAIAGTVIMLVFTPVPFILSRRMSGIQAERMKKTDARVQDVVESVNLIRMIKMFAWERMIKTQVMDKREEEIRSYKKRQYLGLVNIQAKYVLQRLCWQIPKTIQAKISLERVSDFLKNTELLDAYTSENSLEGISTSPPLLAIGFRNATFTWASRAPESYTPSQRNFKLRIDGELLFQWGQVNMIVGPTGCGKTSLLMALLGEMHFVPSSNDSWFGLPRERGLAYAAQEAWVHSGSIRDNILFGLEYNEERYNAVLSQCALQQDLLLFSDADKTEVGERGVTLSGGQKARISLARAIYSKAEVIILDDVLSALDVHTSRWVVDRCLKGDLIAGRTVLIVTHNVAMVSEVADYMVVLGSDGRLIDQGNTAQILRISSKLRAIVEEEREEEQGAEETDPADMQQSPAKDSAKKPIVKEEVAEGHVDWSALKLFLLALGGMGFWAVYLAGFVLAALGVLLQTYWLGVWARAYDAHFGHPEEVDTPFYLGVYSTICVTSIILFGLAFVVHIVGSVRASRSVHDQLLAAMLSAPLRWFDSTPVGRLIARFTQDMYSVDEALPSTLQDLIDMTIQLGLRLITIVAFSPAFILPGVVLLLVGYCIAQVYIAAQLWTKRESSNARSPVLSYFGAALAGVTTIRAYGAEDQFKNKAMKLMDNYTRASRAFYNLNRWVCVRMDTLGATFSGGLAAYLVYSPTSTKDASSTGFSLNIAIAFSGGVLWWVRNLNKFEVQGNSLERIQAYIQIEQEPATTLDKVPPAYWPSSGNITVENLVARYSVNGPAVLRGLSFGIKSGERVGIVGRTGSGKSSLTLSLLRMIPIEGNIYYDGIPTHDINLNALRSNITIIPQQPELMSGTIRQNLDPFNEHNDAVLNAALQSAGLNTLQTEGNEGYIGLDSGVSIGGSNFSLGQRQIIALARAIVRRSKVLILDEATAAIDYDTDTAIQHSIRTELSDKTLIIVAHRLQTICDADKIIVLEAGNIVEFDSPAALLQKDGGVFKSLVDGSSDRTALYAMAHGHAQSSQDI
ncbi:hypothetical protein FRC12_021352 [Ceratobasidium sp. 428]|nr:hypothetical protein FRC12_021352 [Ceratobasidium sp. 428]